MCESRCATPFAATGHPLQIRVGGIPLTLSLGFGFLPRAEELNVECYDGWGQGARRLSRRACLERGGGRG